MKKHILTMLFALSISVLLAAPAIAQSGDDVIDPVALTAEPTSEPVATVEVTATETANNAGSVSDEAVAVASVNLLFAFVGGLGLGGLGVGAILMLLVTLILRSPVILTAIEGLIFSRLDKEGVATVRGFGTVFSKTGELIDKVTDGKPNEPAQNVTVNVTTPSGNSG